MIGLLGMGTAYYPLGSSRVPEMIEETPAPDSNDTEHRDAAQPATPTREIGGREGPEPTRFGDWEKNGRCIDF